MSYTGKNPTFNRVGHRPQAADPSNPLEGQLFYSDGTPRPEGLYVYKNGAWTALADAAVNLQVTSKTANYTAINTDQVILCDATSAAFTVSLFTAVGNTGITLYIKKTDFSTNAVTIDPSGAQTIDTSATYLLTNQGDSITIVSDGANWQILDIKTKKVLFVGTQVSQVIGADVTDIAFTTTTDTNSGWSANAYTVKVPGDYQVAGSIISTTGGSLHVYKNAVHFKYFSTAAGAFQISAGCIIVPNCVVGDVLTLRLTNGATVSDGILTILRVFQS